MESVLLLEYARSLTKEEKSDIRRRIQDANSGASEEELKVIHRDAMLKAALEARKRKRIQDAKDASLSLPSPAGSVATKTIQ